MVYPIAPQIFLAQASSELLVNSAIEHPHADTNLSLRRDTFCLKRAL
jgi:hypothetical protein